MKTIGKAKIFKSVIVETRIGSFRTATMEDFQRNAEDRTHIIYHVKVAGLEYVDDPRTFANTVIVSAVDQEGAKCEVVSREGRMQPNTTLLIPASRALCEDDEYLLLVPITKAVHDPHATRGLMGKE